MLRYVIFSTFKDGDRRHLGLLNFPNFNSRSAQERKLRHRAKLPVDRSNRCWDMAIFRPSQDGGRPLSWICDACVRTTYEGHLVVFTVQNLVGIDAAVLIICIFFDFANFAWKRLFTPQNCFLGDLTHKWGAISTKPQKAHPCASLRRLSHHARKSIDRYDLYVSSQSNFVWVRGCGWVWPYVTNSPKSSPWMDMHQIWHRCRGRRSFHTRFPYSQLNSTQQVTSKDGSQEERSSKSLIMSPIL